jgi:hypothetical protein
VIAHGYGFPLGERFAEPKENLDRASGEALGRDSHSVVALPSATCCRSHRVKRKDRLLS